MRCVERGPSEFLPCGRFCAQHRAEHKRCEYRQVQMPKLPPSRVGWMLLQPMRSPEVCRHSLSKQIVHRPLVRCRACFNMAP